MTWGSEEIIWSLVVAISEHTHAIGYKNRLPWDDKLLIDWSFFRLISSVPWSTENAILNLNTDVCLDDDSTSYNAIVMGRNTAESIGPNFPLSNRVNIVMTESLFKNRSETILFKDNAWYVRDYLSLEDLVSTKIKVKKVIVIGGASLYDYFIKENIWNTIFLTLIDHPKALEGEDSFFPYGLIKRKKCKNITAEISNALLKWTLTPKKVKDLIESQLETDQIAALIEKNHTMKFFVFFNRNTSVREQA